MKPKWVLEKNIFQENIEAFKEAIVAQGMEYKVVTYAPFEGPQCLGVYDPKDCVVFYGSLNLAKQVQKHTQWVPGAWCNLPQFECVYYYPKLSQFLLNDRYIMLPYGELLRQKDFLYETLGNSGCLFIRPSSGFKLFTGTVVHVDKYEREVECFGLYDVEPHKVVVVSEPQNLLEEWRLVIADQRCVTGSLYKNAGKIVHSPEVPQEVIDYGNLVAGTWQPDPVFVLDVCRLKSGELKLIEINSFSSSGLYVCDKAKIVEAASAMAVKEWGEYQ